MSQLSIKEQLLIVAFEAAVERVAQMTERTPAWVRQDLIAKGHKKFEGLTPHQLRALLNRTDECLRVETLVILRETQGYEPTKNHMPSNGQPLSRGVSVIGAVDRTAQPGATRTGRSRRRSC